MKTRIYVDFNSRDQNNNVVIHPAEATRPAQELTVGMRVTLYDEGMEVEAQLQQLNEVNMWIAVPDWSTRRYTR